MQISEFLHANCCAVDVPEENLFSCIEKQSAPVKNAFVISLSALKLNMQNVISIRTGKRNPTNIIKPM